MSAVYFRLAEESDNNQILELAERSPLEGMISFFMNRTPGYNTLHRLLDPGAWHYVAIAENRIIGLVGVVHFPAMIGQKPCKIAYMLDLKVDTKFRNGTTAYRLVRTAVDHLFTSDVDMVIANFVKDNHRSLVFTKGRGNLPPAHYLGRNRIASLVPLLPLRENHRFTITPLRDHDIREAVDLLRKYGENFKIKPVISESRFRRLMEIVGGLSPDHFLVARENGKMKALTACWDEGKYQTYQVLKLTREISLFNQMVKLLSHVMKTPAPIRMGEPLRQLTLALYAHDQCPEALESIFRRMINLYRGSDYTMIMLYAQANDPVFQLVKNFISVSVQSEMYVFARNPSVYPILAANQSPVLFDLSMLM
jgi:hypothetical protein